MKREQLSEIICNIDERHIAEAYSFEPDSCGSSPERITTMNKKRIISLALAAALVLALGVTAYAVFSSMSHRVPGASETFTISWPDTPGGIQWSNAKLVISFPEKAESKEIEFRPLWLPDSLISLKTDSFTQYFTAESLAPDRHYIFQPLQIQTYAMSMFNQGGALLLLYNEPQEITEEHWDELNADVMYFHATQHLDASGSLPERTLEQNIILMSNAEKGWIVRLAGQISMEKMIEVAKNLEIQETGNVLRYSDFENHYAFIDAGVG